MEYILLYGFLIIIVFIAGVMLAYPFIVLKQKRFTKMDLITSIIMYGIIVEVILSKLYEDEIISPIIYFSSFGVFLLILFISPFIDLKVYKKRNKSVIGNGLFLSKHDLFVITDGLMPLNMDISVDEKMKANCNDNLAKKKLGSLDNPSLELKNVIEPIVKSNYIITNNPNLQGSNRMIYTNNLIDSTFAVEDKDDYYLERLNLNDITINKLYEYVKWCTEYVPDDFSFTLPFEEGKEVYKTLIFDKESDLPLIKFDQRYPNFTNEDISKMIKIGVSESFVNAAIKLGPAIKFFYGSIISQNLSVDLSIFDGPTAYNLASLGVTSYFLEMDKKIGPTLCEYNIINTSENKKEINDYRTVEVYPKHGIAVIIDSKDNNKKITFKSVKNNQELLSVLMSDL
ncbi:MAG: hypothetical protein IKJ43_00480 [Bacilli bacterium]|nr:hypothetical protein [Bacilli bacterium]